MRRRLAASVPALDAPLAEELGIKRNTSLQNSTRARPLLAAWLQRHGVNLALERL